MRTAVETGTAREQTVAVRNLTNIFVGAARRHDRPRRAIIPHVDVLLSVEGDDALAGGARRRLNAHAILQRNRQQSVRICRLEIGFRQERQFVQIVDRFNIIGSDARILHFLSIVFNVIPNVFYLTEEFFVLYRANFFQRRAFDFLLKISAH